MIAEERQKGCTEESETDCRVDAAVSGLEGLGFMIWFKPSVEGNYEPSLQEQ
jgi:hypothetical protein